MSNHHFANYNVTLDPQTNARLHNEARVYGKSPLETAAILLKWALEPEQSKPKPKGIPALTVSQRVILGFIQGSSEPITRARLAEVSAFTYATVSVACQLLKKHGFVKEVAMEGEWGRYVAAYVISDSGVEFIAAHESETARQEAKIKELNKPQLPKLEGEALEAQNCRLRWCAKQGLAGFWDMTDEHEAEYRKEVFEELGAGRTYKELFTEYTEVPEV